eukprot:3682280-Amphidinium_carterae.1
MLMSAKARVCWDKWSPTAGRTNNIIHALGQRKNHHGKSPHPINNLHSMSAVAQSCKMALL